jgi:hypothetical protein
VEGLVDRGHEVTLFATGDSWTRGELRSLYPQAHWPPGPLADLNPVSWGGQAVAKLLDVDGPLHVAIELH